MKRYTEQLISDLKEAEKKAPKQKKTEDMTEKEFMAELIETDRIIDEEPEIPMHNVFGIDPKVFPPVDRLTTEQAKLLAEKILQLWAAFNIDAVYPIDFPLEKLYPLLVKKFKEPFLYFPMGQTGVEFCDYEPENCPFGDEYCDCKEIAAEIEKDEAKFEEKMKNLGDDELPF